MRFIAVGFGDCRVARQRDRARGAARGRSGRQGRHRRQRRPRSRGLHPAGAGGTAGAVAPATMDARSTPFGGKSSAEPRRRATAEDRRRSPGRSARTFETHRLVLQQYVADGPRSRSSTSSSPRREVPVHRQRHHDRLVGRRLPVFLADNGETGFRASDLSLSYTHLFRSRRSSACAPPWALTAPISYDSQLASNITTPSLPSSLSRRFGDLLLQASIRGAYFWDQVHHRQQRRVATRRSPAAARPT